MTSQTTQTIMKKSEILSEADRSSEKIVGNYEKEAHRNRLDAEKNIEKVKKWLFCENNNSEVKSDFSFTNQ